MSLPFQRYPQFQKVDADHTCSSFSLHHCMITSTLTGSHFCCLRSKQSHLCLLIATPHYPPSAALIRLTPDQARLRYLLTSHQPSVMFSTGGSYSKKISSTAAAQVTPDVRRKIRRGRSESRRPFYQQTVERQSSLHQIQHVSARQKLENDHFYSLLLFIYMEFMSYFINTI